MTERKKIQGLKGSKPFYRKKEHLEPTCYIEKEIHGQIVRVGVYENGPNWDEWLRQKKADKKALVDKFTS